MRSSYADEGFLPEIGDQVFVFDPGDEFVGPVLAVSDWPQAQILGPDGSELWYELDCVYPDDGPC